MKKRWITFFCVVCLLVTSLAGCGGSDEPSASAGNGNVVEQDSTESYTASQVRIVKEGNLLQFTHLFRVGDTLLGVGLQNDYTFQLYSCGQEDILKAAGGSLSMSVQEQDVFGDRFVRFAFPGIEKAFYTLEREETTESRVLYLCSYGLDGSRLWETDITDSFEEDNFIIWAGAADSEGRLYLSRGGENCSILIFDDAGVFQTEIELGTQPAADMAAADGIVWCVVQLEGTDILYRVDPEKEELQEEMTLPEGKGSVSLNLSDSEMLLFGDYEGVKEYEPDTGELTRLYTWVDAGVTGMDVSSLFAVGDYSVGALTEQGNGMTLILLRSASESVAADADTDGSMGTETEKIEIVLQGGPSISDSLLTSIGSFNMQSDKYKVVLRTYPYEGGRLEAELASGEGPDLLDLTYCNMNVYAEKGMLEDLTPYLEQSNVLSPDQLNQRILELYTIDDQLFSIPPTFTVETVMGRASELGTEAGWTLDEFRAYVDRYPGATVYEGRTVGGTQEVLVWTALWASWDKVIDYEEKKAYFDSDYFKEILEYAANYDAIYDAEAGDNVAERLNEGKLLLLNNIILGVHDYVYYKDLLNGDIVLIGEPTEEGTPRHGIVGYGEYAISASSENKEGAWEFIEYLVSIQRWDGSAKYRTFGIAIPTLIAGFEEMLEYEQAYFKPTPTDEELDEFRQLVGNVSYRFERLPVENIIGEELEACFSGARSVEDTAKIIQNRVQLYLDEM